MATGDTLNHPCTTCAKSFSKLSDLIRHLLTKHTLEKPYRCSDFKSDFSVKDHLRDHIRRRQQSQRTTGEGCNSARGPTDERPQQKHNVRGSLCEISNQDVSNSKGFECTKPGCSYVSMSKGNLNKHMAVHSQERPFGCSKCSSRFKRKQDLRRHLREVHSPERPFECTKCSSRFITSGLLRRHLRQVHSPDRPFGCSECSSRFNTMYNLQRHLCQVHKVATAKLDDCLPLDLSRVDMLPFVLLR